MYHILVIGAGYTGTAIARYFRQQNQRVYGLIRHVIHKERLEREGIIPVVADLTRPETLRDLPNAHFIVWSSAPDQRTEEAYRNLYIEGMKNFLFSQKSRSKPFLMVHLSSTGVYGDRQGNWVDEKEAPLPDNEKGKILLESEEISLNSSYASLVLRLAGIYGPDRNRIQAVRQQKIQPAEMDQYMNMIHVDDIPEAVHLLFKEGKEKKVYLGTDEEPVKQSEFYAWLLPRLSLEVPKKVIWKGLRGKRCSNRGLKELGFQWKYPSFREGYASLLESLQESLDKKLSTD